MPRQWRFASHDRGGIAQLVKEMRCSPLLAQVLAARGIHNRKEGEQFLDSKLSDLIPPDELPGAAVAADAIVAAVRSNRRVTIYGDYDVDGVTSTSLLWHCLKLVGANVDYYIPSRLEEGYGLNSEAIRTLHQEDPERLLVTVDCGICSVEEVALANELGMQVIVTDHHTFGEELPASLANVHPRLPGSNYGFPDLCGAGVAFKLAWAICQRLGDGTKASPRMRDYLKSAVGLAALGTIADVVPLRGENRVIVKYGLHALVENSLPGIEFLRKIAGYEKQQSLSAEDIAFGIAPRINAAGRLGQARLAVELLTTDKRDRAVQLVDYLDQLNKNRQTVERRMFKEAKEMIEAHPEWEAHPTLVVASEEFHAGVMGIVASRLVERFQKPTIVIACSRETGIGQGSGRTCRDYNLHASLAACSSLLERYGGHKAAAGLRISIDQIDAFRQAFAECAIAELGHEAAVEPEVFIDAEISLHDLTTAAVRELDQLGPFGAENRRPVFSVANVVLAEPPATMGGGDRHLALKVRQGEKVLRVIAFGKGEWAAEMAKVKGPFALSFSANINQFRGYENVELQLHDWHPADVASANTVMSSAV